MYDAQLNTQVNPGAYSDFSDALASPFREREAAALRNAVLVGMLDEIDYGLMVLGADAQILLANQLARLELGEERFLRRRQDRLVSGSARHGAKIDAALASIRRGQRSLVTLSAADAELVLSFVPLDAGAQPAAQLQDAPLALVILGKRDACEALTLRHYANLHGLSGAEQALLPAVVRGLSVKAMAQQQRVAPNTVRTQLASLREKTGAKSLRTLIARLISLPPIRPARKQMTAC